MREVLGEGLGARRVVVGEDFRFGKGRAGDTALLEALGRELGFEVVVVPAVGDGQGAFSSSRVREALARGDVASARAVLGRPHAVTGVVVEGDRLGRTLGFPTANLGALEETPAGLRRLRRHRQADGAARGARRAPRSRRAQRRRPPTVTGTRLGICGCTCFRGRRRPLRTHLRVASPRLREERRFAASTRSSRGSRGRRRRAASARRRGARRASSTTATTGPLRRRRSFGCDTGDDRPRRARRPRPGRAVARAEALGLPARCPRGPSSSTDPAAHRRGRTSRRAALFGLARDLLAGGRARPEPPRRRGPHPRAGDRAPGRGRRGRSPR